MSTTVIPAIAGTGVQWSLDSSGNPVGLYGADGQTWLVISADAPSDGDGRPNGTIYIQTA